MAKRTNLRLVAPPTHSSAAPQFLGWRAGRHPAGALRLSPSVRDRDRIVALEGALIRVAGMCSDLPDALSIISDVLSGDPDSLGDGPR
jgi:hypothetical protein